MTNTLDHIRTLNLERADLWISEAKFGFKYVQKHMSDLPEKADILEIGCGSGILLSMLSDAFPQHTFSGMEPFGDGFSALKDLNTFIQEKGVHIDTCGYETYEADKKFDLIYAVNVFEHVNDWRDFLNWASKHLKEGGLFLVLCPNYGFPCETHFGIPIIVNKRITYKVFKNFIHADEFKNNVLGLWDSLNFVKKRDVKKFIKANPQLSLTMEDDTSIIDDMVARIHTDPEFQKRQKLLGRVATLLNKVGLFKLCKLFPNQLPYMKINFYKKST